jgi:hypothetical protein
MVLDLMNLTLDTLGKLGLWRTLRLGASFYRIRKGIEREGVADRLHDITAAQALERIYSFPFYKDISGLRKYDLIRKLSLCGEVSQIMG